MPRNETVAADSAAFRRVLKFAGCWRAGKADPDHDDVASGGMPNNNSRSTLDPAHISRRLHARAFLSKNPPVPKSSEDRKNLNRLCHRGATRQCPTATTGVRVSGQQLLLLRRSEDHSDRHYSRRSFFASLPRRLQRRPRAQPQNREHRGNAPIRPRATVSPFICHLLFRICAPFFLFPLSRRNFLGGGETRIIRRRNAEGAVNVRV